MSESTIIKEISPADLRAKPYQARCLWTTTPCGWRSMPSDSEAFVTGAAEAHVFQMGHRVAIEKAVA